MEDHKGDPKVIDFLNYTATFFTYSYNGYLESTYVYGPTDNTYMFIAVDDFVGNSKNQVISCLGPYDGYFGRNLLGRIQQLQPAFNINTGNDSDRVFKERDYFGNVKIRKLRITLLDKYGKVLSTNNSEISLALEFTQRYNSQQQQLFNTFLNNNV